MSAELLASSASCRRSLLARSALLRCSSAYTSTLGNQIEFLVLISLELSHLALGAGVLLGQNSQFSGLAGKVSIMLAILNGHVSALTLQPCLRSKAHSIQINLRSCESTSSDLPKTPL